MTTASASIFKVRFTIMIFKFRKKVPRGDEGTYEVECQEVFIMNLRNE